MRGPVTGSRVSATGRSVAWVATTGPTRGRADVVLDGTVVVDTVNLYSAAAAPGAVVWAGTLPLGTTSPVTIVNRSGRPASDGRGGRPAAPRC